MSSARRFLAIPRQQPLDVIRQLQWMEDLMVVMFMVMLTGISVRIVTLNVEITFGERH